MGDWAKPSHDLAARSVAVFDGDLLVGYAELMGADRADTAVLPSHRGPRDRHLAGRVAARPRPSARLPGRRHAGARGLGPGDRLLAALGYEVRWTSWVLQLPEGTEIPARELPGGVRRPQATDADLRAAHDVLEDAFLEWSVRDRESFEDFRGLARRAARLRAVEPARRSPTTAARSSGCRWSSSRARAATAYVARLAVRRDQRDRGSPRRCWSTRFRLAREHGATRLRAEHRLPHRRPRALREGRDALGRHLGEPRRTACVSLPHPWEASCQGVPRHDVHVGVKGQSRTPQLDQVFNQKP